jgi:hypothetical protein
MTTSSLNSSGFFRQGRCVLRLLLLGAAISSAYAQPFTLNFTQPTMDRWMYPFNASPGCRATAPIFGTLGDESGVDARHGQFLVGFDTLAQTVTNCGSIAELPSLLATNQGAANYLLRRVRLTVVINRDKTFRYDPTPDAFTTYFESNNPARTDDLDIDRPIELFGADFRNSYTVASFWEDAPFGSSAAGRRNAFAAGYSTNGALVDVGNNVGKTNAAFPRFEVYPFAIGQTDTVAPGELVPTETVFSFDLNLDDPLVRQYAQEGLNGGRLRFMFTGMHTSSSGGGPAWPDFFTRDSVLGSPATLEIEGTLVTLTDTDADDLPDDWEQFYFSSLDAAANDDTDSDGRTNAQELSAGTNPNDSTSALRIVSVRHEIGGACVLRFNFAASHRYVIEHSSDLATWSAVENPALIYYTAPGVAEWRDDGSQTGGLAEQRFYRIAVK